MLEVTHVWWWARWEQTANGHMGDMLYNWGMESKSIQKFQQRYHPNIKLAKGQTHYPSVPSLKGAVDHGYNIQRDHRRIITQDFFKMQWTSIIPTHVHWVQNNIWTSKTLIPVPPIRTTWAHENHTSCNSAFSPFRYRRHENPQLQLSGLNTL